jgi:gliding motility-associated-like protein
LLIRTELPVRYFFFIFLSFLSSVSLAQLSAPGVNAIRYTSYPSAPGVKDPVFIYCNNSGTQKGTIQAVSPGGTGPFNFSWSKWNDITKSFDIPVKTDVSVLNSTAPGIDEGGYKVRITDGGGYDISLTGWVFIDKPLADAKLQNFTCDYVALSGKAAIDTFYYRDPANGVAIRLRNAISFNWSSTPVSVIPYPNLEINPVTFTPPLEDVTYKLQVIDSFLCASGSSFPYTSIHVKADFSVDPEKGEAPLEVSFTDKSIRGYTYKWEFGDDSVSTLKVPLPHIYYRPGEYSVKLTIESDQLCVDSMRFDKIVVDPSDLKVPNVFTPDGDGINDYFIVESKSLRSINVEVFSRSGLMVYNFAGEGTSLKDWLGWDGNVNRSSAKATPGVYFYIIRARGWDDRIYDSKEYRGILYLYR